jgi:predicted O-methyltransferase YrrM
MSEELELEFVEDWFTQSIPMWLAIARELKPRRILEIGSYEGRSTCWLSLECSKYAPLEIFCVDSWQGGAEHAGHDFSAIEERFNKNTAIATGMAKNPVHIHKRKGLSSVELSRLVVNHEGEFDLIYVDGSHMASDVFLDAALAWKLLRVGGILIFDDYSASHKPEERFDYPKLAIDAFLNTYGNKLKIIHFNVDPKDCPNTKNIDKDGNIDPKVLYQMYVAKIRN